MVRVFAGGPELFLALGAMGLFGMGNIVGPPLVKRYFSDRQATAMSLLVLTTQGGATIPAMLSVEDASNWRVAVGCWAVLMVVAALPWIVAILRDRRGPIEQTTAGCASGPAYGLPVLIRNRGRSARRCSTAWPR